jgi:hypothetical protein
MYTEFCPSIYCTYYSSDEECNWKMWKNLWIRVSHTRKVNIHINVQKLLICELQTKENILSNWAKCRPCYLVHDATRLSVRRMASVMPVGQPRAVWQASTFDSEVPLSCQQELQYTRGLQLFPELNPEDLSLARYYSGHHVLKHPPHVIYSCSICQWYML